MAAEEFDGGACVEDYCEVMIYAGDDDAVDSHHNLRGFGPHHSAAHYGPAFGAGGDSDADDDEEVKPIPKP